MNRIQVYQEHQVVDEMIARYNPIRREIPHARLAREISGRFAAVVGFPFAIGARRSDFKDPGDLLRDQLIADDAQNRSKPS
jgi:hypothetical protein